MVEVITKITLNHRNLYKQIFSSKNMNKWTEILIGLILLIGMILIAYLKIKKNSLKSSRFGFVVSKKFSQKAVARNKVRRRLRELVRIKLPKIKKGIDGVVVIMPDFKIIDFWQLEEIVNKLFKKAKLI